MPLTPSPLSLLPPPTPRRDTTTYDATTESKLDCKCNPGLVDVRPMLPSSYYALDPAVSPCVSPNAFCKSTLSLDTVTDCATFSAGVLAAVSPGFWKHAPGFAVSVPAAAWTAQADAAGGAVLDPVTNMTMRLIIDAKVYHGGLYIKTCLDHTYLSTLHHYLFLCDLMVYLYRWYHNLGRPGSHDSLARPERGRASLEAI